MMLNVEGRTGSCRPAYPGASLSNFLLPCLAAFLVLPTPALAVQDRQETEALRSPALAAGLAVVAPTALIFLSSQSTDFVVNFSVPVLGLGAGHVYAGDPLRGALVTVGSTAVGLGTFALLHRSGGNGGGGAYAVGMFSVGLAVGLAAADAYWTTEQKNREALSTRRAAVRTDAGLTP